VIEEGSKQIEQFTKDNVPPGVRLEKKVLDGGVVSSILGLVKAESADLIVMGTHGTSGFKQWLTGSTTHAVLDSSQTPVLTVCNPTRNIYPDMTYVSTLLSQR